MPVFWVGLPPIRGTRSTADAQYLNQLYRARAEANGILYVDVWDGFVDEAGKYSNFGPDYEGQIRRLRSGDGVYFTRFGARKLLLRLRELLRRVAVGHRPRLRHHGARRAHLALGWIGRRAGSERERHG